MSNGERASNLNPQYIKHVQYGALSLHLAATVMASPTASRHRTHGSLIVERSGSRVIVTPPANEDISTLRIEVEGTSPIDALPKDALIDMTVQEHSQNPLFSREIEGLSLGLGARLLSLINEGYVTAFEHHGARWSVLSHTVSEEDQEIKDLIDALCRPMSTQSYQIVQTNPALGSPANYTFYGADDTQLQDEHVNLIMQDPIARKHLELAKQWSSRIGDSLMIIPFDDITRRYRLTRLSFSLHEPHDKRAAVAAAHIAAMKLSAKGLNKS